MPRDLSCREFHPGPRQRVSSPHARCLQSKLPPTKPLPLLSCRPPGSAGAAGRGPAAGESPRPQWVGSWNARVSRLPPAECPPWSGSWRHRSPPPRRAPAHAARPGASTPVRRTPAARFSQSSRCVATGSLSLQADQSPRAVQDSRRSICTYTLSFLSSSFSFFLLTSFQLSYIDPKLSSRTSLQGD